LALALLSFGRADTVGVEAYGDASVLQKTRRTAQILMARPEVPDRPAPLCIVLPGGAGRMPEATAAMAALGNAFAERGWVVAVLVSPDGKSFFGGAAEYVIKIMDQLVKDPDVRQGKILLAGVSNGGMAALQVASLAPSRVSGVIAVPGALHSYVSVDDLRHLPIFLRVGADDQLNWAKSFDGTVRKLKRAGVRLDAELLHGVGHAVPIDWSDIDAWMKRELGALAPAVKREKKVFLPERAAEFRVWTSQSGRTLEAVLLEIRGDSVILLRRDGQQVRIQRRDLSDTDQASLQALIDAADNAMDTVPPLP
jgi:pimeloyl-ACP methyl ester carboxylesterase